MQGVLDDSRERFGRDRFPQKEAELVWFQIARIGASHDNDRNFTCVGIRAQFPVHIMPPDRREHEIENNDIRPIAFEMPERAKAVGDGDRAVSGRSQRLAIHLASRGVVFDDENSGGGKQRHTGTEISRRQP